MSNIMSKLDHSQVLKKSYDDVNEALKTIGVGGSLVPEKYDYIALTYVPSGDGAGQIQTVIYKLGGASGTTVGTLTLGYNSSSKLISVTRA